MPCSCGNTICPCGIPCYCSEKLCECQACEIALSPFCKICNKPLITDISRGKNTCSCFVGDSTALIFENRLNPQWRMGNIPMPIGYVVHGKLIINVMIPVPNFPQFIHQRPISLMPSSPLMQADSKNILPSFISDDVITPLFPGEVNGSLSTTELHESSSMRSNGEHITKSSNKETYPPPILQSTDEKKTENRMQNLKSEIDDTLVQELSSFYLPSVRIGDISYPVNLEDPVWSLPNPDFCTANNLDPTLKLYNPFYMPEPAYRTQTVTAFEKDCCQPPSSLNFDTNDLAQSDSLVPRMREQPSFNLGKRGELEELPTIASGNGSAASSLTSGYSEENMYSDQCGDLNFYNSPSHLIAPKYLSNEKMSAIATQISSYREQKLPIVQLQPMCTDSTFTSVKNDYILQDSRADPANGSKFHRFFNPEGNEYPQIGNNGSVSTNKINEGNEYLRSGNNSSDSTNKINEGNEYMRGGSNSSNSANNINEGNEYMRGGNNSSDSTNKINEENDSIPLYIDTSTTEKMSKLLQATKYSRSSTQIFTDMLFRMQNSTNNNVPNSAPSM